jgi:hypothetical protein
MRYRLRTLMIVLAILPPLLWFGWAKYEAWKAEQDRRAALINLQIYYEFPTVWPIPLPVQPSNQDD